MGGGNSGQTNDMLKQQQQRTAGITDTIMNQGNSTAGYNNDQRGFITDQYKNLLNGIGSMSQGGGGGGVANIIDPYSKLSYDNGSQSFYQNLMQNGGMDPGQQQSYMSQATAGNPAFFGAIKDSMDRNAAVRGGGYAGYSGQEAKLARDQAQGLASSQLNAQNSLNQQLLTGKEAGASGVNDIYGKQLAFNIDKSKSAAATANAQAQARAAAANRGYQSQQQQFADKMGVLNAMQGMRTASTSDLPYYQTALQGSGLEQNDINHRVNQPSFLGGLASTLGGLGGLAGAVTPFASSLFKKPQAPQEVDQNLNFGG